MVIVAMPDLVPVRITGLDEPKLNVGGSEAPDGLEVILAVNATLPVNPPLGITAIADVFPVVAPAAMVTAVPWSEKAIAGTGPALTLPEYPP